jgi:hypothetical protein
MEAGEAADLVEEAAGDTKFPLHLILLKAPKIY